MDADHYHLKDTKCVFVQVWLGATWLAVGCVSLPMQMEYQNSDVPRSVYRNSVRSRKGRRKERKEGR